MAEGVRRGGARRHDADAAARGDPAHDPAIRAAIDHAALAGTLDPLIVIDSKGTVLIASDSCGRVLGWPPDDLIGQNVGVLMPEPHRSAHDGYLEAYARTGRTSILGQPRELEAVRRDGERIPIELSVSKITAPDGSPLFVGLIRDLTHAKRLERELRLVKDLAVGVGGATSLKEAFESVLAGVALTTGLDYGEAWLPIDQGPEMACCASWLRPGVDLDGFIHASPEPGWQSEHGLIGRVLATGLPMWFDDLGQEPACFRRGIAMRLGLGAACAVPVLNTGRPVAVLLFFVREPCPQDREMLELVATVAAPLATLMERKRAETQLQEELGAMTRLHELVHRLVHQTDIAAALGDVLDASIALTGAAMGDVQLLDRDTGVSTIAAHRGFGATGPERFRAVKAGDGTPCSLVIEDGDRVVIEDVKADPRFGHKAKAAAAGFQAVQSTPLIASGGALLGVLTTHFPQVHRPPDRELRILDLYARQAADFIENHYSSREKLESYRHALEHIVETRNVQLNRAQDQLRMAERLAAIGTLAAGLGHDMNNVLLPVRAHVNALKALTARDASMLAHAEEVSTSVAYLQQLADGLHYLSMDPQASNGDAGPTDLARWWTQVGPLLEKACARNVSLGATFDQDCPPVAMAPHRLTQAVLNLVVNAGEAIRSLDDGDRRPGRIRVSSRSMDGKIRLRVADNGCGMNERVQRRAFDMFYTTKPRGMGTGLGLALVHKLATDVGGTVGLRSRPGRGSAIEMLLPAARWIRQGNGIRVRLALPAGRVRTLLEQLFEDAGARFVRAADRADVWVTPAASLDNPDLRRWRERQPLGRLVVVARRTDTNGAACAELAPVAIADEDDFEALRSAVTRSMNDQSEPE
ncbi:MAG: GAF domain-containing protein [Phycisphaeraceae bacterium]|nr:GAF domain-containing protein [Phycisphaeraceae bacterium]